jgi:hypothetical protein
VDSAKRGARKSFLPGSEGRENDIPDRGREGALPRAHNLAEEACVPLVAYRDHFRPNWLD